MKLRIIYFICLAIFLNLFTGCFNSDKQEERDNRARDSKGDILIGAAGPWQILRDDNDYLADGIKMAVEEINNSGGVLGRKIKIVWKDDEGTIRQGKIVAGELCENPDVVAVIGHVNSSVAISSSVLYNHYGIVMLSPMATAPSLTKRAGVDMIFRTIASDTMIAKVLAEYATNTGFKNRAFIDNIVIYNEDDIYGNELAKAFAGFMNNAGIRTVARRVFGMDANNVFFKKDLAHVEELYHFDSIFIASINSQAIMIIKEAAKLGIDVQVICAQGVEGNELISRAGDVADGVVYCSTFNPETKRKKAVDFIKKFREKFGRNPDDDAVQGYDAVYVLTNAMKNANSSAPTDIATALHKITYDGVAGIISFDKKGDLIDGNIVIMKIEELKEKVIEDRNSTSIKENKHLSTVAKNIKPSSKEAARISSMLDRAKKIIEKQGEKGFAQLTEENKKLGSNYIVVYDEKGVNYVDPNTKTTHVDRTKVLDANGNPIVEMILEEAARGGGWIHYLWTPVGEFYPQWKTTKVITAVAPDGEKYILFSGSYNLPGEDQFAVDLVDDFVSIFKEKGMASFVEFKYKSSRVASDEISLFMLDSKGRMLFYPGFTSLESRNMYNYKDAKGNYVVRDIIELAEKRGGGWIEFYWETPQADGSRYRLMRVYVKKVDFANQFYIVCGGYFPK